MRRVLLAGTAPQASMSAGRVSNGLWLWRLVPVTWWNYTLVEVTRLELEQVDP